MSNVFKISTRGTALCFVGAFVLCIFFVEKADAYFTTHQEASVFNNTTALFIIDYSFGVEKHDIFMPLIARDSYERLAETLSYKVLRKDGLEANGTAMGIVLSDAEITDSMTYLNPRRHEKKYKLIVLFTPKDTEDKQRYRLQVTHLPFNFDGVQPLQLNVSELEYYTTRYIKF